MMNRFLRGNGATRGSLSLLVLGVLVWESASAGDLDQCDFKKEEGSCAATFTINKETNYYTIPADGTCRTVTVQVDGTQYPHKQKDKDIVDAVMVLDKRKNYEFKISGCTTHPTRQAVVQKCVAANASREEPCLKIASEAHNKCAIPEKKLYDYECWTGMMPAFKACEEAAIDALNACVGANLLRVDHPSPGVVTVVPTGEYLPTD